MIPRRLIATSVAPLLLLPFLACSAGGDGAPIGSDDAAPDTLPSADAGSDTTTADAPAAPPPDTGADVAITEDATGDAGADAAEAGDDASDDVNDDAAIDAAFDARDTGVDAFPEAGSPCSPQNAIETQSCGVCGTQSRVCLGMPSVWQPWGACTGQAVGGCVPGTQNMTPCGFCGTLTMLCQTDCTWAVSECQGQPPNACAPNTLDFEPGLSCTLPDGRQRTCSAQCSWGGFGSCEVPPDVVVIGDLVGNVQSALRSIPVTPVAASLTAEACPTVLTTTNVPYDYVQVQNLTTRKATLSVWSSQVSNGPNLSTVMAAYAGATPPSTATQRKACLGTVTNSCADTSDPTSCQASWAGLMIGDGNQVTVGPGASLTIYTGGQTATDRGAYWLRVRTEALK